MVDLTPAERERLARILGMVGSEHAGERAAAGLKAEEFRKKHGLTWAEMLAQPPLRPEPPPRDTAKEAAEAKARAQAEAQRAAKAKEAAEPPAAAHRDPRAYDPAWDQPGLQAAPGMTWGEMVVWTKHMARQVGIMAAITAYIGAAWGVIFAIGWLDH